MMRVLSFLFCVFVLLVPSILTAEQEVVKLKSGETVEGKVIAESGTEVRVKREETTLVLPKAMIEYIEMDIATVTMKTGKVYKGHLLSETDLTITLRFRLGELPIDKQDTDKIERSREKVILEIVKEEPRPPTESTSIAGIPKPKELKKTENLSEEEIKALHQEAQQAFAAKDYKKAAEKCAKILRTNPKDASALYNMSCALSLLGKKREAIEYLIRAVDAGFTDFVHIETDKDLDNIRKERGYAELMKRRDPIQKEAAEKSLANLKQEYGEGYAYEIDDKRKLIFATNLSMEVLQDLKKKLNRFADNHWAFLFKNKPSYYITIVCPSAQDFRKKVPNPNVGGFYNPQNKILTCADKNVTLLHEFTHALHFADQELRRQGHPIWLVEGIATLYESAKVEEKENKPMLISGRLQVAQGYASQGKHIPLEKFTHLSQQQYVQNAGLCYAEGRYIQVYIYEQKKLKEFYQRYVDKEYEKDPSGVSALEAVFGKPLSEIESDWRTWLLALKGQQPAQPIPPGGPYIGVRTEEVDEGLSVQDVPADSPADKAGLQVGDIITAFDGKKVSTLQEFIAELAKHKPGDKVELSILRQKEKLTLTVTLGTKPEPQ
jgi:tetratricopeptide (TPR) repeat protein